MKRTFASAWIAIMALALGPAVVHAQWGIKVGLARADLVATATSPTPATGISAGIVSNMGSGPVSFMSEGLFVQKGYVLPNGNGTVAVTNNWVDITGLLRVNLGTGPIKPILFGGGYYSYLISEEFSWIDSEGFEYDNSINTSDGSYTDYGWVVGGGVVLSRITIDARYTVGLKHTVIPGGVPGASPTDHKAITVMLGVQF